MASIIERNGRWRAQVRRKGSRPLCRTFASEAEASAWADEEEKRVAFVRNGGELDPKRRPTRYQVAGVYALYSGGSIRYVGRSVHIYRRLNDHHRVTKDWDSFSIWPCADSINAAELEHKLIQKHQPPLNVQMTPRAKRKRRSAAIAIASADA